MSVFPGNKVLEKLPRLPVGGLTRHRPSPRKGSTWSACFQLFISLLCIALRADIFVVFIMWNLSLARDGEIYLASSSSRTTIRKRPAADPSLLGTCIVPQPPRKHPIIAVVQL